MDEQGNHERLSITPPRKKGLRPVVLVTNSAQVVIRTVTLPDGYKLNAKTKWEQVLAAFPFGRTLNEGTHIFDGSVYRDTDGHAVFCMAALPLDVAEVMTQHGVALPGGIRKITALETMETVLFRHFCTDTAGASNKRWVIYPCGDGIKVLIIHNNAPDTVRFLPLAPLYNEAALRRTLAENPPTQVLLLTRPFWGASWRQASDTLTQCFTSEAIEFASFHL